MKRLTKPDAQVASEPLSDFSRQAPLPFRTPVKQWVGVFYLLVVLLPLFVLLSKPPDENRRSPFVFGFSLVVVLAYPVWSWCESLVFERWVRRIPDEGKAERERAYFKLMMDHATTFWAALVAGYVAALIKF
jgi:hypothetical protein